MTLCTDGPFFPPWGCQKLQSESCTGAHSIQWSSYWYLIPFLNAFTKRKVRLFHQRTFFLCYCCLSSESPLKMIIFSSAAQPLTVNTEMEIFFFLVNLFILFVGQLLCNIVVVFAIRWHESDVCTCVPLSRSPLPLPYPSHSSGLSQCTGFECLVSWIELGLVSHMVIYMFQCYSLKSSHPCLILRTIQMLVVIWVAI